MAAIGRSSREPRSPSGSTPAGDSAARTWMTVSGTSSALASSTPLRSNQAVSPAARSASAPRTRTLPGRHGRSARGGEPNGTSLRTRTPSARTLSWSSPPPRTPDRWATTASSTSAGRSTRPPQRSGCSRPSTWPRPQTRAWSGSCSASVVTSHSGVPASSRRTRSRVASAGSSDTTATAMPMSAGSVTTLAPGSRAAGWPPTGVTTTQPSRGRGRGSGFLRHSVR